MERNRNMAMVLIVLMGIVSVLCAGTADAKPQRNGQGPDDGQRPGMNRPMFGEILSISETEIVIAPAIPQEVLDRMAEQGVDPPTDLPAEISVSLTDKTRYFLNSEAADSSGFSIGDLVVIAARKAESGPQAIAVSDIGSAKNFLEKRGNGQGSDREFGLGDRPGEGNGRQLEGRGRPFFGEIISIDSASITIKPELPDFVLERMDKRGSDNQLNLPDRLTFSIGSDVIWVVAGEPQDSGPFAAGDMVAVIMTGTRNDPVAVAIADYATAEERAGQHGNNSKQRDPNKNRRKGRKHKR